MIKFLKKYGVAKAAYKFGGFMQENNEYEEILLFSSANDYQINEVCAILTDNNIKYYTGYISIEYIKN